MAVSPLASLPADRRDKRHRVRITAPEVLKAIRRWHEAYGEPPTMADWDPYRARSIGQEWRIARYDAGDWPSAKTVRNHFGRLSEAVAAAGLTPRYQGQQRAYELPKIDDRVWLRVAHMKALRRSRSSADLLAAAVREVAAARTSDEPGDLKAALIELAATALAWAAQDR